ncbi:MAG: hypothetical protein ACI97N_001388 [Cognaticolwellia sp.]|jgi:hypothetical protein
MKIKLSIVSLIFCLSANAQLDSTRIETFNDKLQVGLFISDNYAKNTFQYGNNQLQQIPALKPTIGFQLAYNGLVLAVGTGFSIPHPRYDDYKITDVININGYFLRPKYMLWGTFRHFKGFEYSTQNQLFSNTSMLNVAGSFTYIFSENKYSPRAAFRQVDQQIKSGGSWLIKGYLNYSDLYDSTLIVLGKNDFRGVSSHGVAMLSGYGYTLSLNQNWFVSGLLLSGVEVQRASLNNPILTERRPSFYSFTPAYDFKSSIGYNSNNFYMVLIFDVNNFFSVNDVEEISLEHQYLKTDLRFGIRIDAPNVLKKISFLN